MFKQKGQALALIFTLYLAVAAFASSSWAALSPEGLRLGEHLFKIQKKFFKYRLMLLPSHAKNDGPQKCVLERKRFNCYDPVAGQANLFGMLGAKQIPTLPLERAPLLDLIRGIRDHQVNCHAFALMPDFPELPRDFWLVPKAFPEQGLANPQELIVESFYEVVYKASKEQSLLDFEGFQEGDLVIFYEKKFAQHSARLYFREDQWWLSSKFGNLPAVAIPLGLMGKMYDHDEVKVFRLRPSFPLGAAL